MAYLAGGRLHVKLGEAPVRSFDSAFGQQVRDRHVEIQQKHSWKEEGRGARFMGNLLWGVAERDAALRVAITSLTRGSGPGELLYALDTEGRTAVCLFRAEDASERRLLHGSAQRIRDLRAATGREHIACSVQHPDGTASIAVMGLDATDLREVTEGDVQDRFPAWAPGPGARLVYQSASLGRDAAGRPSALGPSEVHLVDLESGALETLASDPGSDFVCPQLDAHGTLHCIRRPHRGARAGSFFGALLAIVLVPARLLFAVFQYLNFFSARYTGKPLITAGARGGLGGPVSPPSSIASADSFRASVKKGADIRQMMQWSNLMEADQAAADEPPSAVPRSWQLVRIRPGARPETIAEGVIAFDLAEDGSVLYSTGSAIHFVGPDGRHQRLLGGERVEALVAFS
jgi:hypothetical protein